MQPKGAHKCFLPPTMMWLVGTPRRVTAKNPPVLCRKARRWNSHAATASSQAPAASSHAEKAACGVSHGGL